jgi:hypothetical protein
VKRRKCAPPHACAAAWSRAHVAGAALALRAPVNSHGGGRALCDVRAGASAIPRRDRGCPQAQVRRRGRRVVARRRGVPGRGEIAVAVRTCFAMNLANGATSPAMAGPGRDHTWKMLQHCTWMVLQHCTWMMLYHYN